MSTTALKLPQDLKKRAAAAAQSRGITPHAFMVSAIEQAALASEKRAGCSAIRLWASRLR